VGTLARRFGLPVFINPGTQKASFRIGNIKDLKNFKCGSTFKIKNLTLHPFSISHDAEDPSGFTVSLDGTKVGIATDLGVATAVVKEHLKNCSLLILEANHDPKMLENGPYPWPIKQRIQSRAGHLSNEASKNLLKEVRHDRLEHVILAHISGTNNTPEKALNTVGRALTHSKTQLSFATQDTPSTIFHLS
jgi:phosphoribosyl 1,2-cyclic phosphodiesterase